MGREYKILMVKFFNSLEMRVQRSEFKGKQEIMLPAEDSGPIDRAADRSCMKHAYEVSIDCSVDRTEEGSRTRSISDRAIDRMRL